MKDMNILTQEKNQYLLLYTVHDRDQMSLQDLLMVIYLQEILHNPPINMKEKNN